MKGRVYFVSAPGRIKIGYTVNPEDRLGKLRQADMEELTVIGIAPGTRRIEARLHQMVGSHRLKGEWFADCAEVRSVIDDYLSGKIKLDSFGEDAEGAEDEQQKGAGQRALETAVRQRDARHFVLMSAIDESKKIADEVGFRIRTGEPIKDLSERALFLAEKVIAPLLYGAPPSGPHIGKDP